MARWGCPSDASPYKRLKTPYRPTWTRPLSITSKRWSFRYNTRRGYASKNRGTTFCDQCPQQPLGKP